MVGQTFLSDTKLKMDKNVRATIIEIVNNILVRVVVHHMEK